MEKPISKPAAGGKGSLFLGFAIFWLASMALVIWYLRKDAGQTAMTSVKVVTITNQVEAGKMEETDGTRKKSRPNHYAEPLAPGPLVTGPTESPVRPKPVAVVVSSPAPAAPVPVLVVSGGNDVLTGLSSIRGKVFLKGTPPPEINLRMDETCGKLNPGGKKTQRYMVARDGGLANVVVYIAKGLEGQNFAVPSAIELNQTACMYQPYVSAAMVGQTVKIRNSDAVLHNVHALPKVDGNREFNFGQPSPGMVDETTFTKKITTPEVLVKLKCDVHDWMLAYVAVLDNPFFSVTDTNGNFAITNLPPGNYTVVATHLKAGSLTNSIHITEGQNAKLKFAFSLKQER